MKLFVWDFHGVLEKDNEIAVLEISNKALEQNGFIERFSEQDVRDYYGLKWYEYFERLLPNEDNDLHRKLQNDSIAISDGSNIVSKHIKPNDFAVDVICKIKESGHDQILLSNTAPEHLLNFIKFVNMEGLFDDDKIIGVDAHRNFTDKKQAFAGYLSNKDFDKIIIIGDSDGDMQLKNSSNQVTYFYRHPYLKSAHSSKADYFINDLREILNEI